MFNTTEIIIDAFVNQLREGYRRTYGGLKTDYHAADLIGQLSDPRYLKKITSLFYEFEETGVNKALGYKNPGELRKNYAKFYWNGVYPYIKEGLRYLGLTQQGKQVLANLYSNVFVVEHEKQNEEIRYLAEQLNG